jgi:putative nucleotidyltransferase with HDIG domain
VVPYADLLPLTACAADAEPMAAVAGLLKTLARRDPHAKHHSMHVRQYAVRLARELGMSEEACQRIALAAKLHDIGKLGLSDVILNKPGRLTEEEMMQVREHPTIGVEIIAPLINDETVLAAIRGHHERFDGGGYPDGLSGEEISLEARILAIADCFDALVSSRSYRLPLPRGVALDMIDAGAGSQFDPMLVTTFLGMFNLLSEN